MKKNYYNFFIVKFIITSPMTYGTCSVNKSDAEHDTLNDSRSKSDYNHNTCALLKKQKDDDDSVLIFANFKLSLETGVRKRTKKKKE